MRPKFIKINKILIRRIMLTELNYTKRNTNTNLNKELREYYI